jgi:hypothetical protein
MQTIKIALRLIFMLLSFLIVVVCSGQPYEIRAVNKGNGIIGVEMRSTGGTAPSTTNFITDITFGIKWSEGYNVDLANDLSTAYNIRKSGTRSSKNGYHFQAFYAESIPYLFPANWQPGNWIEILSVANTRTEIATGRFEIAEPGFDPSTNPNIGVDLLDYTPVINGAAEDVLLPIKLTSFKVVPTSKVIELQWSTSYELNSKGFQIERSDAANSKFKKIGWVESKGNGSSGHDYVFTDKDVTARIKYYYRLMLMDRDEQFKFSEVKTAMMEGTGRESIYIAPNPVGSMLQVYFDSDAIKRGVTVKVMDAKGAVLISQNQQPEGRARMDINVSTLAVGQYYIVVQKNKEILFSKSFQKR